MKSLSITALILALAAVAVGAPSARDVVVRGGKDLSDLLSRATADAWKDAEAVRPVAIVVDVTPHTAAAQARLLAAFESIGDRITHLGGAWRIGALGKRLSDPVRHPSALVAKVPGVLADETFEVNTFRALQKTLANFKDRNGVVVYLADWRFEDDADLEGLISRLKGRSQTLRIIGSEGCFGRGWNDGLPSMAFGGEDHDPNIGRNPFGPRKPDAPWHGGDTASPHAPYSFGSLPWKTEFPLTSVREWDGGKGFEDLADRIGRGGGAASSMQLYPLASSFGPYALMRAAGETGGRYFLYSWNPGGRVDLVYDYGNCNLFEPDLRSRREILGTIRSDPIPVTMVKVWRKLADPALRIATVSPPFSPSGAPDDIDRVLAGQGLRMFWPEESDRSQFLARIEKHIRALKRATRDLDRALSSPPRTRGPWPRYRADARLLAHTVLVLHFEMREAREAAKAVPATAWDDPDRIPGIGAEEWIRPGNDPEAIRTTSATPYDEVAGERIRAARRRHLETYRGTPFGETVARNPVVTYRPRKMPNLKNASAGDLGRTPSESGRKNPKTRPGGRTRPGGSSGGGSSSGK